MILALVAGALTGVLILRVTGNGPDADRAERRRFARAFRATPMFR